MSVRFSLLRGAIEDGAAAEELEKTREVVDGTLARLRSLMFDLHPPDLVESGLAQTIRLLLKQLGREGGPQGELRDELTAEPASEIQMIVYRVTKEALASVKKHSRAGHVRLTLASERDGVSVVVRDDGQGFDAAGLSRLVPGHIGVRSMRERTEIAGGSFRIESGPGEGTTVQIWVPLGGPPDPG